MLYQSYFQMKNRLTDALTINWGLHSQLFVLNNSKMVEPRFGMSYSINSKQSINVGYGLHGQIQPRLIYFTQTLIDSSNPSYSLTNKELGFSKSHHFIAGYEWSNNGLGENMGLEFTLEKYLNKNFYFLLTASLYDSKYRGSDLIWRNSAFNGNYTVNCLAGYELPIKNDVLSINIKTVWAGGKRYIPIDIESSIATGEAVYDYSRAYSNKYKDYFRTDLRIAYRKNSKRISQEWSFDVQNLTNHRNIFTQRYDSGSKRLVDVLQMGFFPIGSWKIYF
jgi:hypothetical protein